MLYCFLAGCSHHRAPKLFLESVENPDGFVSTQCEAYLIYLLGLCNNNKVITLGGELTAEDAGKYYFTTNSKSPYSKQ